MLLYLSANNHWGQSSKIESVLSVGQGVKLFRLGLKPSSEQLSHNLFLWVCQNNYNGHAIEYKQIFFSIFDMEIFNLYNAYW